jgi:hypothetical protein
MNQCIEKKINKQLFFRHSTKIDFNKSKCTLKIYGLGKVKLKIKWPGSLEKNTNLVENVKEIN